MNFKMEIADSISSALSIPFEEALSAIEIPPDPKMGEFAYPCFKAAKLLRKPPLLIAKELADSVLPPKFIERAEAAGPYLNFFVHKSIYVSEALSAVLQAGKKYGASDMGAGKTVVIDYSSPNIAKPFHVGHLRSTVIGNALKNIYARLGYKTIGVNHLGDWGTQFGKLITAYKLWSTPAAVAERGIDELMRIYVKFHEEAEKDSTLEDRARNWFVRMEAEDPEAISLWKSFYDISMVEFQRVYKMLGVSFDYYTGESFYNHKMDAVIEELREKGLLTQSDGAQIVELPDMPPCLIIRSDGGTLYATRDITAAIYRKETFDFHKALYVTALDQSLHFAQWFKVIEKMGYPWAKSLYHVPFGLVSLKEGKISTRSGRVVLMEELLNEATRETRKIIEEKNPELSGKEQVAADVGIGAVIFNDLYNSRIKDVIFSWEKMLSFDGETGPYVQYTHARCASLLKKAAGENAGAALDLLTDDATFAVVKLLEAFPDKIVEAADKNEPYILTRHLMALAQAFNKFYHDNPVLTCETEHLKGARLSLVSAVKTVLAEGLGILGIKAPEQM